MSEDPSVLTDPKSPTAKEWMGDTLTWKEIYKAQPLDYVQLIADGETPMWDKNLEKFIAKGDDSETESSFKSQPSAPVQKAKTSSAKDDDYDEEEPF
jgi:hypothetical protein